MRPYEFKTSSTNQQNRPFSTLYSLSKNDSSFQSSQQPSRSDSRDFNVKDTKSSQTGSSFSGNNNINDMKSRLDQLLKQTQMLSTDKKIGSSLDKSFDLEFIQGINKFNGNVSTNLNKLGSKQDFTLGGQSINNLGNRYKKQQPKPTLTNSYRANYLQQLSIPSIHKKTSSEATQLSTMPKLARPGTNYDLQVSSPKNKFQNTNYVNELRPISNIPLGNRQNILNRNSSRANFDNLLSNDTRISDGLKDFPSFNLNLNLNLSKLNQKFTASGSKNALQSSLSPSNLIPKTKYTSPILEASANTTNFTSKLQTSQPLEVLKKSPSMDIQLVQKAQSKKEEPFQKPLTTSPATEKSHQTKDNQYIYQPVPYTKPKKEQVKRIQVPDNLLQCQIRLRVLDQDYRKLKEEFVQMTEGKQYYRKQLSQSWRSNKQLKDQYEQKIIEIKRVHSEEIQKLDETIRKKQINITQLINQLTQAKSASVLPCFDQKVNKIMSQNTQMIKLNTQKERQITDIKAQLAEKDIMIDDLTQKVYEMEDQIRQLNNFKTQSMLSKAQSFDDMLKMQLKSIAQFKQLIERLNDKIKTLRQKLIESVSKSQRLANQNKILQLKYKSSLNSAIMQHAIQQTNKQNTINNLKQRLTSIQQRHKIAVNEIKNKDQFLRQHLISITDSTQIKEHIESVLSKYKEKFIQQQLRIQLDKAYKKISLYQKYS